MDQESVQEMDFGLTPQDSEDFVVRHGTSLDPEWMTTDSSMTAEEHCRLGIQYITGDGVPTDKPFAMHHFTLSANMGCASASFFLGECFKFGQGTHKNPEHAFARYQEAAARGHNFASVRVGQCYYHGSGCEKDLAQAFDIFKSGATRGYVPALKMLALCYERGHGVKQDTRIFQSIMSMI